MAAGRNSSKDVRATTLPTIPNPCQWAFAYLCLLNPAHSCPNGERQRSALQNVLKAPISCPMIHEMKPCEVSQTRRALQNLSSELTRSWWVDALWVLVSSDGASPEPPIATHKNYSHSTRYCGYSTARADLQATVGGSQSHPRARATKWLTPRTSGRLCVWATTKWRLIHCPRQDGSSVSILPSIASAAVAAARDASCQLLRTCQQTTKLFWCKMQNGCSEPSYIWFGQFRSDFTASSEMGNIFLFFFFGGGQGGASNAGAFHSGEERLTTLEAWCKSWWKLIPWKYTTIFEMATFTMRSASDFLERKNWPTPKKCKLLRR